MAGMPSAEILRYVIAWGAAVPEAPKRSTKPGAVGRTTAITAAPRSSASQMPSMPCRMAAGRSPAPTRRATAAVVAYARKTKTLTAVVRRAEATPSPASWAVPRWPTMALSAITKSGSATSAPNAGTASATISRSCRRRTVLCASEACVMRANLIFHR